MHDIPFGVREMIPSLHELAENMQDPKSQDRFIRWKARNISGVTPR